MPSRAEIEARVSRYLDRNDLEAEIPWWFMTAHKEAQRLRNLKAAEATAKETLVADQDSYCIPDDLKEVYQAYSWDPVNNTLIRFYDQTQIDEVRNRRHLAFPLEPQFFSDFVVNRAEFQQNIFAIWANAIEIWPKPKASDLAGKELRLDYYRWFPIPDADCSDFLTLNAFDFLLYRMLEEAVPFLDSTDLRLSQWQARGEAAKKDFLGVDVSATWAGSLVMRG